ncbi:thiamine phosphate synthase [Bartonella sp. A05]|uniref:thiamine phosphate synthase n=1 Tax=Bartonella sp. A05 TaxID=2967261 RepID=UPI0022A99CF6|nr:thiamine phosphate synthase [Bartonella sp. A05]MCZ2203664.1 thiamine phosphate synthase [Bartonella sp. A05]
MTKQKNKSGEICLFPQLVLTLDVRRSLKPAFLHQILQTESFACVILYDSQIDQGDEVFFQNNAQLYADDIQRNGAALLIADEGRIAGRIKADGLHLDRNVNALKNLEKRKQEGKIIGFGNLRNRHSAMNAAEAGSDYLLFGKLGADKKRHSHPRNIQLAQWWAEIMEIPAIIQAGSDPASFDETLATACEFIAVEEMIFAHDDPLSVLDMIKRKCIQSPLSTETQYP